MPHSSQLFTTILVEYIQQVIAYEPFGLGRFATGTHSQRPLRGLCSFVLGRRGHACIMYCIKSYSICKSVSFASHSIILNKHIVIDLRLLFIQRNTQASNNLNTM